MKYFIGILVFVLLASCAYFLFLSEAGKTWYQNNILEEKKEEVVIEDIEEEEENIEEEGLPEGVIGYSEEGREIHAYMYGTGDKNLVFIGGIHGGYSWNTVLLAYELMDYLKTPEVEIPENVMITVIPVANPDGLYTALGTTARFSLEDAEEMTEEERTAGRFNTNGVDLNRNFDCEWSEDAVWKSTPVSAGDEAFSEAESIAIRDFLVSVEPELVIAYFNASGDVITSKCGEDMLNESEEARDVYADASGYNPLDTFTYYETTGDMTDWLAKVGISAISVVLETSDSMEWSKNRAGIEALFENYAE